LRSALNTASGSGANPLSLSQIGITTDPSTGKLNVDDAKLDNALRNHPQEVSSLFTSATGVGKLISGVADRFTRSDGLLSVTTQSLNTRIDQMQAQYNATADRIDQRMETYRQQF